MDNHGTFLYILILSQQQHGLFVITHTITAYDDLSMFQNGTYTGTIRMCALDMTHTCVS